MSEEEEKLIQAKIKTALHKHEELRQLSQKSPHQSLITQQMQQIAQNVKMYFEQLKIAKQEKDEQNLQTILNPDESASQPMAQTESESPPKRSKEESDQHNGCEALSRENDNTNKQVKLQQNCNDDKEPETPVQEKVMKGEFMAAVGLVTKEQEKILKQLTQERRKRCNTKAVLLQMKKDYKRMCQEADMKNAARNDDNYVDDDADDFSSSGSSSGSEEHGDACAQCERSGQLLLCDTCPLVYHLYCLRPPLATVPRGPWQCPICKQNSVKPRHQKALP